MTTLVIGLRRLHCLLATALLDECKGLRSPCGHLMTTLVVGLRRQHCLVAMALLNECEDLHSPLELGQISLERGHVRGELGRLLLPLALFCGKGVLVVLCLGECGPSACFLGESVLKAGTSGFLLLFFEELLAASSLLAGTSGSGLLAGTSGLLVKELLAGSSLLVGMSGSSLLAGASGSGHLALTSGFLVEMALAGCRLEAMALVFPQGVDHPLPIQVGAFCAGASPKKDGPPRWVRKQYPSSLFVFAKGLLKPFFVTKGTTNIGRGIKFLINVEHPVEGAWGRLRPLVLQPR
jgi:hypothetical protein